MNGLEPPDSWCPLLLPHVEVHATGITVMGTAVPMPATERAVLRGCRGDRPMKLFEPSAGEVVARARLDGLIVLVPPSPEANRDDPAETVAVISAHPDDAVLSLGCTVAASAATIIDVFSHETWSPRPHYARDPLTTARVILEEERAACRVVGATPVFLGFRDAPLRGLAQHELLGATDYAETLRAPGAAAVMRGVADALRDQRAVDAATTIYAPLGIGGHVDHLLCLAAVAALVGDGTIAIGRLRLYEDLPYAALQRASRSAPDAPDVVRARGLGASEMQVRLATADQARAKAEALRAYRVQLRSGVRRRVLAHGRIVGSGAGGSVGERVWSCRS